MMNLTSDRVRNFVDRIFREQLPMAAGVLICEGAAVALDPWGNAVSAGSCASPLRGIAVETIDNTEGDAGDETIRLLAPDAAWFDGDDLAQSDVGLPCWFTDDHTVTRAVGNRTYAGRIRAVDANGVLVDLRGGYLDLGSIAGSGAPIPTLAPTTAAPMTNAPTPAPTTQAPTLAPTTPAPTTPAPTTPAPTTPAPTTPAPTTPAPTTPAPTTPAPTAAPTTPAPQPSDFYLVSGADDPDANGIYSYVYLYNNVIDTNRFYQKGNYFLLVSSGLGSGPDFWAINKGTSVSNADVQYPNSAEYWLQNSDNGSPVGTFNPGSGGGYSAHPTVAACAAPQNYLVGFPTANLYDYDELPKNIFFDNGGSGSVWTAAGSRVATDGSGAVQGVGGANPTISQDVNGNWIIQLQFFSDDMTHPTGPDDYATYFLAATGVNASVPDGVFALYAGSDTLYPDSRASGLPWPGEITVIQTPATVYVALSTSDTDYASVIGEEIALAFNGFSWNGVSADMSTSVWLWPSYGFSNAGSPPGLVLQVTGPDANILDSASADPSVIAGDYTWESGNANDMTAVVSLTLPS